MMKTIKLIPFLAIAGILFIGCSDDDNDIPEPVNQEEVITTMNVTLTTADGAIVNLKSYDSDGDGPNAPQITVSGPLAANTTYSGELELLNETENAENVTLEIMEEADEHQFFFSNSDALDVSLAYADTENDYDDDNDNDDTDPVGILFTLSTVEASAGTLSITLIHEPQKDASGVAQGDSTNAGGETDFTATFPIVIE